MHGGLDMDSGRRTFRHPIPRIAPRCFRATVICLQIDENSSLSLVCNCLVTQELTVYYAIADPTRRAILDALREGRSSAGDLARRFPISRPAVSRHVRVLRDAGLVRQSRERQTLLYSLNPAPLAAVDRWLNDYRVFGARDRS